MQTEQEIFPFVFSFLLFLTKRQRKRVYNKSILPSQVSISTESKIEIINILENSIIRVFSHAEKL